MNSYKIYTAHFFAFVFHFIALALLLLAIFSVFNAIGSRGEDIITSIITSINTLVIALAMYELGTGVSKEYTKMDDGSNIISNVRRTITRFVGTVVIALVLESLIMIIKYSQVGLAGNLYYPVAIICATSMLLLALGGFLVMTRDEEQSVKTPAVATLTNQPEPSNVPQSA
jgi:hypothetical protein